MPHGLKRFQQSGQTHFVTFTCYHRRAGFASPAAYDLFVEVLEDMRRRFAMHVYGYVVMPEHVHLLVSEPPRGVLADAIHYLKLSFSKRLGAGVFWQKRYYDRNIRNEKEFREKLRYLHRNPGWKPVKRGLCEQPQDWTWSSFRHYALGESRSGDRVGRDGERARAPSVGRQRESVPVPRLASKTGTRTWATHQIPPLDRSSLCDELFRSG